MDGPGILPSVQATQAFTNPHVANTTPKTGKTGGNDAFFHPFLCLVMKRNEHDMLSKFLKLEPQEFLGLDTKDAYEFILNCYERLYKLGIVP